ncbi:MAG: CDP-glucose 4,6-dehydratase, partial [Thermoflexibacteraceae bacterium]
AFWLHQLGAKVIGYALSPTTSPNHIELLNLPITSIIGDVRDEKLLQTVFQTYQPDVVFHLAAQPLVRASYAEPILTFETNVIGTAKVYEAVKAISSVKAVVNVTTDKVYHNNEWVWGYRENDKLGGHDPYSTSKACVELLHESYRKSFFKEKGILTATARAGNVIGGGDWSQDRLIPDIVKATVQAQAVQIRNPQATRPWQHVLEPLAAYLLLGQQLLEGNLKAEDAWNFACDAEGCVPVRTILTQMQQVWQEVQWQDVSQQAKPHEANLLQLDCTKAKSLLQWQPVWNLATTVELTTKWYRNFYETKQLNTAQDLQKYIADAQEMGLQWAKN